MQRLGCVVVDEDNPPSCGSDWECGREDDCVWLLCGRRRVKGTSDKVDEDCGGCVVV